VASGVVSAISIQTADFDPGVEIAQLGVSGEVGAVATFVGLVRGATVPAQVGVVALELEHYPGMTERSVGDIVALAAQRWQLQAVKVIHRIGRLAVGDRIVFVGVASRHRGDAFAACEFIMDYLKTRAPFWKKEWNAQEQGQWVEARETDQAAAARWSPS
jgi:molybdopterin synthase catalytic subunit